MVQPNQLMVDTDFLAIVQTLANSKTTLPHRPFLVNRFGPQREVNDRGAYAVGIVYNRGDQVTQNGYKFIAGIDGLTASPLDTVTLNPNGGWEQPWQSAYQRLRDALHEAVLDDFTGIEPWEQSISGPWPCQKPDILYNHLEFYYPDTGKPESVTLGGNMPKPVQGNPGASGKFTAATTELWWGLRGTVLDPGGQSFATSFPTIFTVNGNQGIFTAVTGPADPPNHAGQFLYEYTSATEFQIAVGGTQPVNINATFTIPITAFRGIAHTFDGATTGVIQEDITDPSGLVVVDTSHWLPGAAFTPGFQGWQTGPFQTQTGAIVLTCVVNGTFEPGIYTVKVSSTGQPNNRASGSLVTEDGTTTGSVIWRYDTFLDITNEMFIVGSCGLIATTAVEVPGVHDTKRVLKIAAPPFNADTNIPTGVWVGQTGYRFTNGVPPSVVYGVGTIGFGSGTFVLPESGNPNPYIFVKQIFTDDFGLEYSASTDGFWFGITPPTQSLGLRPFDKMPWNIFPVSIGEFPGEAVSNNYLGYKPPYFFGFQLTGRFATPAYRGDEPAWLPFNNNNEMLPWPKRWKPLVHYPVDFGVMDSNGNLQVVVVEGRSGGAEPNWPTTSGVLTQEPDYTDSGTHRTDPGAKWKLTKVLKRGATIKRATDYELGQTLYDDNGNRQTITAAGTTGVNAPAWSNASLGLTVDGTATWQLTNFGALQPAVAKLTPPNYPHFWHNASAAGQTDPPPVLTNAVVDSEGNRPYDFAPKGWWIYRVALNRIPQTKTTDKPPLAPVSVTIGCVRNGVFVAFGTYNTGQIINAYWPVFTNTALCYEASERVDLQAAILTCGTNYGLWGTVDFPFAATYLNDVELLLNKIS